MRFLLVLVLVATCALLPACAKKTTIPTQSGPVTVTQENGNKRVTIAGNQGTTRMGEGVVDPNSLGLPVYPGATPSKSGAFSAQTKQGGAQIITLETADSFDKVYAFYRDKMPAGSEKMKVSVAGSSMATFQVGTDKDKSRKGVSLTTAQGKTEITLIVSTSP